jgi:glycopeptide antibiotics resistance protein
MVATWILETASVFLTTCGALLIYLAHARVETKLPKVIPAELQIFANHHRQLSFGLGVIAASLVVQCAALVYL